jgi:hypothetical protein
MDFGGPQGVIQALPLAISTVHSVTDCTYKVIVYMGYGVEIQVGSSHGALPLQGLSDHFNSKLNEIGQNMAILVLSLLLLFTLIIPTCIF